MKNLWNFETQQECLLERKAVPTHFVSDIRTLEEAWDS